MNARELDRKLDLRDRLWAIVHEIARLDADIDVPHTLAVGLVEDVERELCHEALDEDDRRRR